MEKNESVEPNHSPYKYFKEWKPIYGYRALWYAITNMRIVSCYRKANRRYLYNTRYGGYAR